MIPAELYSVVYTILVILLCISPINKLSKSQEYQTADSYIWALFLCAFMILFVGFRPNSPVFADGPAYWGAMIDHRWEYAVNGKWFSFTGNESDNYFAFSRLMAFMSSIGVSPRLCFIVLDAIIYGFSFKALRKLFPDQIVLAFLLFCGSFGTFGFATNGIKNGCAFAFFLCAIAYKDNWKKCLLFLLLAFGFHHSMEISIAAFLVALFYKNTKVYIYVWLICLLLAVAHFTFFQGFFAGLTDEHGASYLLADANDVDVFITGFRLDFVLYSFAPIALGWWIIFKRNVVSDEYAFILNVYLIINSIWLLCMYANFANRIAQLSWSLFPFLIMYPLTKLEISSNQNKILKWFVVGQLSFTLLMSVLYIGRV